MKYIKNFDNYKNFDIDEFKKKLEFDKNIKNFNL